MSPSSCPQSDVFDLENCPGVARSVTPTRLLLTFLNDGRLSTLCSINLTIRALMRHECASCVPFLRAKEEISTARKVGQIIARGDRRWLIRVYLGRDHETNKRKYHNRTIHGPLREAQTYLTRRLRQRDLGRDLEGTKITLNVGHLRSRTPTHAGRSCQKGRGYALWDRKA
jgi:hypothetical protein